MAANSRFVEGNTTDQPPSGFEPGQQTFTVEWMPESDDERLVWEADFELRLRGAENRRDADRR